MGQLAEATGLVVTGTIAIAAAVLALRVAFGNKVEYERNRRRAGGFWKTICGEVPSTYDGTRDARVSAGIAVKNNEWKEQGQLSREAIAGALRRPL